MESNYGMWIKASDGFPVKKRVVSKMFIEQTGITVVGYASSATGEMICFDWNVSSVAWRKGHEELKNLFWLDESGAAPSGERDVTQFTEADADFMRECNLYPKLDGTAQVITENDEGVRLDKDDLLKLAQAIMKYVKTKTP